MRVIWRGSPRTVYFQDGPVFLLDDETAVRILARYDNGAPAAVVAPFGAGGVAVTGPHPEATDDWYSGRGLPVQHTLDLARDLVEAMWRERARGSLRPTCVARPPGAHDRPRAAPVARPLPTGRPGAGRLPAPTACPRTSGSWPSPRSGCARKPDSTTSVQGSAAAAPSVWAVIDVPVDGARAAVVAVEHS